MRHLRLPILTFIFAAMTAVLSACANNPFAVAETASQRGYAVEASYNILLEDALEIGRAPTTSDSVRQGIQRAEAQSTPVIDSLSDALATYEVERAKFDLGQSTAELLATVAANLDSWVTQAQQALIDLRSAFRN